MGWILLIVFMVAVVALILHRSAPVSLEWLISEAEAMSHIAGNRNRNKDMLPNLWHRFAYRLNKFCVDSSITEAGQGEIQLFYAYAMNAMRKQHWERFSIMTAQLATALRSLQQSESDGNVRA